MVATFEEIQNLKAATNPHATIKGLFIYRINPESGEGHHEEVTLSHSAAEAVRAVLEGRKENLEVIFNKIQIK